MKRREWFKCPFCGQKILQFNASAFSRGFFIKCKRCKKELEIKKELTH